MRCLTTPIPERRAANGLEPTISQGYLFLGRLTARFHFVCSNQPVSLNGKIQPLTTETVCQYSNSSSVVTHGFIPFDPIAAEKIGNWIKRQ